VITLVLGGAGSGKSAVAERRAAAHGTAVTYVATAVVDPGDTDHVDRIERHRRRRPPEWTTVECPRTGPLAQLVAGAPGPVLVDSLGTWVAGYLDHRQPGGGDGSRSPIGAAVEELIVALAARTSPTVLVSDEVGMSVHPPTEAGRLFSDTMGRVNQAVAEVCDEVLLVVAGRVLSLPRGD